MIILRCVVQKLCVAKNCIPPGLFIANLRDLFFKDSFVKQKIKVIKSQGFWENSGVDPQETPFHINYIFS